MKKFIVCGIFDDIEAVEVLKETEKTITIKRLGPCQYSQRMLKANDEAQSLSDTWEGAKAFLIARAESAVENAAARLERAKAKLSAVRELKEPAE